MMNAAAEKAQRRGNLRLEFHFGGRDHPGIK